jgi:hypothetical protein
MANVDLERIRSELLARLPLRARWLPRGVPLAFDFSRARRSLRPVESRWDPIFLFNSNADGFVRSFTVLDEALGREEPGELDCERLEVEVEGIDPASFWESEWRDLIEHLRRDGG